MDAQREDAPREHDAAIIIPIAGDASSGEGDQPPRPQVPPAGYRDPYRALVQEAGNILWTATADGLTDAEQGWCPYTGQSPEDVAGWGWLAAVHPDDRERARRVWAQAVADQVRYETTYRIRRVDGVYRTFLVRGMLAPAPIPDSDGHVRAWANFATDITSRQETAAALQASEERLRAHEERLHTVVANAPIVLFAVDRDGVFTLSEGRGLEALGIAPDAHVGQSYFALYGDLPDSVAAMRRALAGEAATTVERFKGLVFETRWTPTRDMHGVVTGVIGVSADITARARAEEERARLLQREQEARAAAARQAATLAATFDVIADGILVYDGDGHLVHANAAAHTAKAWLAQPGHRERPFYERVGKSTPRDAEGRVLPRAEWPIARVLRGEVLTGPDVVDTLVRRPDGRDVLLSVSGAPIRDAEGRIVGGVIVDRDVTERRRLERRTREALDALLEMAQVVVRAPEDAESAGERAADAKVVGQRLAALTRHVLGCERIGLVTFEPETGVQRPLAVVGLSPEQERVWWASVDGQPLVDPRAPADPSLVARFIAGEVLVLDLTQSPYRDQPNPLGVRSVLIAPLRVGSDLVGMLTYDYGGTAHDYTPEEIALAGAVARLSALTVERARLLSEREEARATELALRESNRRVDEFLGIVGHELRTPLTGLRGSLQVMQRRLDRAASGGDLPAAELAGALSRLSPFLDRALHQSGVLAALVDDLLDLSRIQAGQLQLRLVPCELVGLVRQTVEEQQALDPLRTIDLEKAPAVPVWVNTDAERLAQVVTNYLTNALKYSAADQPVAVGVEVDGTAARVWVRDEGPGVPASEQERIWDRFYRAAGTEHRSGSSVGLGLGLYISRTIVERHHGQVGVESASGAGATFWLTLPLAAQGDRRSG